MRIVAVVAFVLSLTVVAGAAVVAASDDAGPGSAGAGPAPSPAAIAGPGPGALTAAQATALGVIKDIAPGVTPEMGDALVRLVERGERRGADYRLWRDFLQGQRVRYGVTSVYLMVRLDRETAGVVLEAVEDPDAEDTWLAGYVMERAMRRAFRGKASVSRDEPWFDPRIRGGAPHVRALAPVRDSGGDIVAIVGVDVEVGDRRVAR